MPIKFTNTAKALKIEWANEDASQTASFSVPKQATDKEQVEALVKALGFLVSQTGAEVPTPRSGASSAASVTPTYATPTSSIPPQTAPTPGPSTGPRVPMMPPGSLSDRPADGGVPKNLEFWQSMPTLSVPDNLALNNDGGWEMIPPGEM
jgi:hypothetical protein